MSSTSRECPPSSPTSVLGEIGAHGAADPAVVAVRAAPWLQVVPTPAIAREVGDWNLDSGESAVLSIALEQPGTQAVLDDLSARQCAQALGIPLLGTLGLILIAKQLGMIPEVRPLLDSLRHAGFYVSDGLVESVLKQAAE